MNSFNLLSPIYTPQLSFTSKRLPKLKWPKYNSYFSNELTKKKKKNQQTNEQTNISIMLCRVLPGLNVLQTFSKLRVRSIVGNINQQEQLKQGGSRTMSLTCFRDHILLTIQYWPFFQKVKPNGQ